MLTLRTSPASPFGRKVRIAAALLGLEGRIAVVPADTGDPADSLRRQNPLGKIPALIAEDGVAIFDSRVIVEYLDGLAGSGRLIPADLAARIPALILQALADGIADAALLQVYERRMREPAERSAKWVDYQAEKVTRGLAALEAKPPEAAAQPMSVRSRSPARSATSTCASPAHGGRIIRGWLAGSRRSPPPFRPMRRPRFPASGGADTKKTARGVSPPGRCRLSGRTDQNL